MLFAKNNPPDCFLTLRPSRVRIPALIKIQKIKPSQKRWLIFYGWGIGIRTPTNRVRVCRATVTLFPNEQKQLYINDLHLSSVFYNFFVFMNSAFPSKLTQFHLLWLLHIFLYFYHSFCYQFCLK